VPSTWPLGSITVSLYGTLASDSATTENPSALRGNAEVLEERLAAGQGVWCWWRSVPGPADAWVLEVLFVTQILST